MLIIIFPRSRVESFVLSWFKQLCASRIQTKLLSWNLWGLIIILSWLDNHSLNLTSVDWRRKFPVEMLLKLLKWIPTYLKWVFRWVGCFPWGACERNYRARPITRSSVFSTTLGFEFIDRPFILPSKVIRLLNWRHKLISEISFDHLRLLKLELSLLLLSQSLFLNQIRSLELIID